MNGNKIKDLPPTRWFCLFPAWDYANHLIERYRLYRSGEFMAAPFTITAHGPSLWTRIRYRYHRLVYLEEERLKAKSVGTSLEAIDTLSDGVERVDLGLSPTSCRSPLPSVTLPCSFRLILFLKALFKRPLLYDPVEELLFESTLLSHHPEKRESQDNPQLYVERGEPCPSVPPLTFTLWPDGLRWDFLAFAILPALPLMLDGGFASGVWFFLLVLFSQYVLFAGFFRIPVLEKLWPRLDPDARQRLLATFRLIYRPLPYAIRLARRRGHALPYAGPTGTGDDNRRSCLEKPQDCLTEFRLLPRDEKRSSYKEAFWIEKDNESIWKGFLCPFRVWANCLNGWFWLKGYFPAMDRRDDPRWYGPKTEIYSRYLLDYTLADMFPEEENAGEDDQWMRDVGYRRFLFYWFAPVWVSHLAMYLMITPWFFQNREILADTFSPSACAFQALIWLALTFYFFYRQAIHLQGLGDWMREPDEVYPNPLPASARKDGHRFFKRRTHFVQTGFQRWLGIAFIAVTGLYLVVLGSQWRSSEWSNRMGPEVTAFAAPVHLDPPLSDTGPVVAGKNRAVVEEVLAAGKDLYQNATGRSEVQDVERAARVLKQALTALRNDFQTEGGILPNPFGALSSLEMTLTAMSQLEETLGKMATDQEAVADVIAQGQTLRLDLQRKIIRSQVISPSSLWFGNGIFHLVPKWWQSFEQWAHRQVGKVMAFIRKLGRRIAGIFREDLPWMWSHAGCWPDAGEVSSPGAGKNLVGIKCIQIR